VGRQAVFFRPEYLTGFGEQPGLWATVIHDFPEESIYVALQNIEAGQYKDQDTDAYGGPLDYGGCAFNTTRGMRQQLELPLDLDGYDSEERFRHGTITVTLSSAPVGYVPTPKPKDARIFAATDQANMAGLSIEFRQFYTHTAAINAEVIGAGSDDGTGMQIAYDRITPEYYACWGIVLPGIDVSHLSRLAFDVKGTQGGERPNVWLSSVHSPADLRNFVDVEPYATVTTAWQRVRIPLADFHVMGSTEQSIDLSRITRVQICFEWEDMAGMIYADAFAFE
jgi:hypothetical protein